MITATKLTKKFDHYIALDSFETSIPDGSIYGLVGSNGSGKSTLLRMISGIYRPDSGSVLVDGSEPFENTTVKNMIFHVSDDLYFIPQYNMDDMAHFYSGLYSGFDEASYLKIRGYFPIDPKKRINTFSKGMKRQAALILALSCNPRFLLLDEAFDGLDPVIRGALRKILADQIAQRAMTVIIASHNLRELEDLCDFMGFLHQGKVIFEREIDDVKLGFCKVQAGFSTPLDMSFTQNLNILQMEQLGSVVTMIVRGNSAEVLNYMNTLHPMFVETVPLTLEEVFIHEMEVTGYDYNKIIF